MKLLIAEDDPRLLKTLVHIFESNKFVVDGVTNGEDALLYAKSEDYDGLVLDIMMPGLDGIQVLQKLRKKFIRVSAASIVIVVSIIFAALFIISNIQLNHTMDTLTDAIASNNGVFPEFSEPARPFPDDRFPYANVITEETRFSTRFFTVWMGDDEQIAKVNVDSIFSISEE